MYVFQNLDLILHTQELFETLCKAKQTKAVWLSLNRYQKSVLTNNHADYKTDTRFLIIRCKDIVF